MSDVSWAGWTGEADSFLRKHWRDPLWSASKIGAVLGCSRNACIGRAHRLGLQKTPARKQTAHVPPPTGRPGKVAVDLPPRVPPRAPDPVAPPPAMPATPRARGPVDFLAARPNQCRFPLWDRHERTGPVCGEPVVGTCSWCDEHLRVASVPREQRRRAA